ncbi:endonuclease III [Candidatus Woesearchaeota archaeon]|nr:endonuclease III [Candidatus Woesearchaeota archaeon]
MAAVNIDKIYAILSKEVKKYKAPITEFVGAQTKEPEQVLMAAILSARTNDKITFKVVTKLFTKVKKIRDFEKFSVKEIEKLIYPIGFFRRKAKYLKELPYVFEKRFNSRLPSNVEELIELPGVGRKTANLVVAVGFNRPAICVDVHVHRIMNRLGYIKTKTPFETEIALREKLPLKYWIHINYLIVAFGQNLCTPLRPFCFKCPIYKYCKRIGVFNYK